MRTVRRTFFSIIAAAMLAAGAFAQTSLSTLDGSQVNVQGERGKVVVLAIGASWLPLSGQQADILNKLAKNYAGKNVAFYFVATDSMNAKSKNFASDEMLRKFVTSNRLTATLLRDPDGAGTLKKFKIEQVPSFVVLDKSGAQVGLPFEGIDPKSDASIPISKLIDRSM